jgi:CubicO group peptidase (beta-lactamase class C family)
MPTLHSLRTVFLACAFLLVGLTAPGRGDDAAPAQIRSRMQAFVDKGEVAGIVTVVGRRDAVLSIEAVGRQHADRDAAMPKDALFRIASMTKPITALGIMILADEGKLSVEDPVEKHLPEFRGQMLIGERNKDAVVLKKPARPITLRDLLTHTSGLPGGYPPGLADIYTKRNRSLAECVIAMSQRPLEFEPGSKWSYCNAGIDTLGRVIEVVSGQSYEDFLQKRIFVPLKMVDTTFYPTKSQLQRSAPTYAKKDGKLIEAPNNLIDLPATGARFPIPAGGLYSTAADLAQLYRMMLGRGKLGDVRIVSEASVAAMTKVQTGELTTGFVPGMGFGFGWAVVRTPMGATAALSAGSYGHGGAYGTQAWLDPDQDLFTVLLIQRVGLGNADGSQMRQELQAAAAAAVKK